MDKTPQDMRKVFAHALDQAVRAIKLLKATDHDRCIALHGAYVDACYENQVDVADQLWVVASIASFLAGDLRGKVTPEVMWADLGALYDHALGIQMRYDD